MQRVTDELSDKIPESQKRKKKMWEREREHMMLVLRAEAITNTLAEQEIKSHSQKFINFYIPSSIQH